MTKEQQEAYELWTGRPWNEAEHQAWAKGSLQDYFNMRRGLAEETIDVECEVIESKRLEP